METIRIGSNSGDHFQYVQQIINSSNEIWKDGPDHVIAGDYLKPGQTDTVFAHMTGEQTLIYELLIVAIEDYQWTFTHPERKKMLKRKLKRRGEVEAWFNGTASVHISFDFVVTFLGMSAPRIRAAIKRAAESWRVTEGKTPRFKHYGNSYGARTRLTVSDVQSCYEEAVDA